MQPLLFTATFSVRAGARCAAPTLHFRLSRYSSTAAALKPATDNHGGEASFPSSSSLASVSSSSSTSASSGLSDPKRFPAYARLRPVVDAFEAPIDLAVAYGSGVVAQANAQKGVSPLTDFILATPSARAFHAANLRQHPHHYPLYARVLGPSVVGWMTERWGAGMWYVTMVKFGDLEVKYGVISTPTLTRDLQTWDTLYVAGRLHKPVLTLTCTPSLLPALDANHASALALALLQLPPRFSELALWEKIAGISYSGDPRMSVPGAENPEKVRNIVRGEGVLDGFRGIYAPHLGRAVGVRWAGQGGGAWTWDGSGEGVIEQPTTPTHHATLLHSLPLTLRRALAARFRPPVVGALVDADVAAQRRAQAERGGKAYDSVEFWAHVASQEGWREALSNEVRHIIRRPALTQSVKGLVTAGFSKSVVYSLAKFRKWLAARKK